MSLATFARSALALAFTIFLAATAQAQSFRAYLASTGSDAHPCTLHFPCRLLPAALAVVANGGEIWMLDSANYNTGPVSITKSVTIQAVPGARSEHGSRDPGTRAFQVMSLVAPYLSGEPRQHFERLGREYVQ